MPKVRYVGPHRPGVDVILEDGRSVYCEHNHEIEVSASDRDSLLKQGESWNEAKRPEKKED